MDFHVDIIKILLSLLLLAAAALCFLLCTDSEATGQRPASAVVTVAKSSLKTEIEKGSFRAQSGF
ncbi:hypothetical protein [Paenibacillus agri]|uniref:Uncharacterized protein n=1 Tax=Paenibacillus agri TaxID=2744309 RepID=A0A850ELL4_9BACL|nr:hypothetical protein [Paenibacillus agri]NUU61928.1 hypothetical protein [Paenibacillus agri]